MWPKKPNLTEEEELKFEKMDRIMNIILRLLLISMLVFAMLGCKMSVSASWTNERMAKKLVHKAIKYDPSIADSIEVTYQDTMVVAVQSFTLKDSVVTVYDTSYIDSVNVIEERISADAAARIRSRVVNDYELALEQDTASLDTLKMVVIAYRKNGATHLEFQQLPDSLKLFVEGKIKCPPAATVEPLNWWQRNSWWLIILVLLFLVISTAKKFLPIKF